MLKPWIWTLADLISPPECAGCGRAGAHWCFACRRETPWLPQGGCRICGLPGPVEDLCAVCSLGRPGFHRARSCALYAPPFDRLILALKYRGDPGLGQAAGEAALPILARLPWTMDAAIPVPLGPERLKKRGYNQVSLFAGPLAQALGIPFFPHGLQRSRETVSQVGLSALDRHLNLKAAFQADPRLVAGKKILLVDDVFTTGTTIHECSLALRAAGAARVYGFTLARALAGSQ